MKLNDFFLKELSQKPKAVIFISGSGTNAEKLLESLKIPNPSWEATLILSDNPSSRASQIAEKYDLPAITHDIRKFYREKCENSISLLTQKGRAVREEWTEQMRQLISPFKLDFGILAGFVPLTNICADFPCLNIHPGDLTVESSDEQRLLVGLHTVPIETAILAGHKHLRSSVIIAQPYTGKGGEMDSGPILGISEPVQIKLKITVDELCEIRKNRPDKKPPGGYKDPLEEISKEHQEKLKKYGDWILFPPVVSDFAAGLFKTDKEGNLYYKSNSEFNKVKTVIYHSNGSREPVLK